MLIAKEQSILYVILMPDYSGSYGNNYNAMKMCTGQKI
jgi:hypothetical protein